MKSCTFFGHRDAREDIKPILRSVVIDLIENHGVDRFYVGNNGNFDGMVYALLAELSTTYPISYTIVLAYLPRNDLCDTRHTLLPEGIERVPPRFAIMWRNKWMIDHSDYVVTHVKYNCGGAAECKAMAESKGKKIINI